MTKQIHKRPRARRASPPVYELAAFSVYGFCLAHGLSRSTFYKLQRSGEGPRLMKCCRRTLISVEAAQRWRRARERVAAASRPGSADGGCRIPKIRRRRRSN